MWRLHLKLKFKAVYALYNDKSKMHLKKFQFTVKSFNFQFIQNVLNNTNFKYYTVSKQ